MKKRKVCIFTGSRAEYGLLRPLMSKIQNDDDFDLKLLVSGMHLSPEFGLTYSEIEKDKFRIDEKVEILLSSDSTVGVLKSIGLGIISYAEILDKMRPDISIVLGDRFEALAFAISNYIQRIPLAHLYGGETTRNVIDEGIRHAITKFAFLHFTSNETYQKRIIQLGEAPERVFNVGALGIDNIKQMKLFSKKEVEKKIGARFREKNLLITFHPITLEEASSSEQFKELLRVLAELKGTLLIFTKANSDVEGRRINAVIDDFVKQNPQNTVAFTNLGQKLYLSVMKYVDAVVGNSSSGIIEAPSLKVATINIGDRQKGRITAQSVIHCNPAYSDIKRAIMKLYSPKFQQILQKVQNPYGDGKATIKITNILKQYPLSDIRKSFFDLPVLLKEEHF